MVKGLDCLKFLLHLFLISATAVSGETMDWDLLTGSRATPEQLSLHDRKAAAHRLRLTMAIHTALTHPEFLIRNPEYRPIAAQLEKVIRVASEHDHYKNNLSKATSTIQTLAKADAIGVDWRSLPEDNRFRKAMVKAVTELNSVDDARWAKLIETEFRNPTHRKLVSDLVTAVDWYDVPFARKTDFGAHRNGHMTRPLDHGSTWIRAQQKALNLPADSVNRMLSITEFFDKKIDYAKIASHYTPEHLKSVSFEKHRGRIIKLAKLNKPSIFAGTKGKLRAGVGAVLSLLPSTVAVAEFVHDPASVDLKEVAGDFAASLVFMGMGATADCDTPACAEWLNQCQKENLDEPSCFRLFLTYPLSKQSQLRLNPEVNKKFAQISGRVDELQCQKDPVDGSMTARIQFTNPKLGTFHQIVRFDKSGKVSQSQVRNLRELSHRHHVMTYNGSGKPGVLQYYSVEDGKFLNLPPEKWTSHVTHLVSFNRRTTNESLESAVQAHRVVQTNAGQIRNCCNDKKCLDDMNLVSAQAMKSTMSYIRPITVAK